MSSRLNNDVGNIFQGKDNLLKSIASYTRAYNTYQQCTAADGGNALAMTYTPYYGKKLNTNKDLPGNYVKTDLTSASNNGTSIDTTEDDCQDICNVNKTCYGFTYDTSNNICRLQGSGITATFSSDPTRNSYIKKYTTVDCGTMTVSSASFSADGGLMGGSTGAYAGTYSLQSLAGQTGTGASVSAYSVSSLSLTGNMSGIASTSAGTVGYSGSIAQSAKALYNNINALTNMKISDQSVIDASYNTMLNQRSSIDIELQNLYNVPNSIPNMYAENWDLTIYMGIIWTILATSLIYYIFTKL